MDSAKAIKTLYHNHFELRDASSQTYLSTGNCSEELDHICDVCDNADKRGATGYCQQCKLYFCRICCGHHKKIPETKLHEITKNKDIHEVDTLFGRKFFPASSFQFSIIKAVESASNCTVLTMCFLHGTQDIAALIKVGYGDTTNIYLLENGIERKKIFSGNGIDCILPIRSDPKGILAIESSSKHVCTASVIDVSDSQHNRTDVFNFAGHCKTMVDFDDGYAAVLKIDTGSDLPQWQLQYLAADGTVKRRVCYDQKGEAMFSIPISVDSNLEGNLLYVLDERDGSANIKGLNIAGDVVFDFSPSDVKAPFALAVDKNETVLLVCKDRVVQFSKDRTQSVVLLNSKSGITHMAFSKANSLIAIYSKNECIQVLTRV